MSKNGKKKELVGGLYKIYSELNDLRERAEHVERILMGSHQHAQMARITVTTLLDRCASLITEHNEKYPNGVTTIEEANFSVRTYSCLHNVGIKTLGQLSEYSPEKILLWKNMGKKGLKEIGTVLAENHLLLTRE